MLPLLNFPKFRDSAFGLQHTAETPNNNLLNLNVADRVTTQHFTELKPWIWTDRSS